MMFVPIIAKIFFFWNKMYSIQRFTIEKLVKSTESGTLFSKIILKHRPEVTLRYFFIFSYALFLTLYFITLPTVIQEFGNSSCSVGDLCPICFVVYISVISLFMIFGTLLAYSLNSKIDYIGFILTSRFHILLFWFTFLLYLLLRSIPDLLEFHLTVALITSATALSLLIEGKTLIKSHQQLQSLQVDTKDSSSMVQPEMVNSLLTAIFENEKDRGMFLDFCQQNMMVQYVYAALSIYEWKKFEDTWRARHYSKALDVFKVFFNSQQPGRFFIPLPSELEHQLYEAAQKITEHLLGDDPDAESPHATPTLYDDAFQYISMHQLFHLVVMFYTSEVSQESSIAPSPLNQP